MKNDSPNSSGEWNRCLQEAYRRLSSMRYWDIPVASSQTIQQSSRCPYETRRKTLGFTALRDQGQSIHRAHVDILTRLPELMSFALAFVGYSLMPLPAWWLLIAPVAGMFARGRRMGSDDADANR